MIALPLLGLLACAGAAPTFGPTLNTHHLKSISTTLIDGDVYKIIQTLPGFESKEIVVKAKKGMVIIQAVHNYTDGTSKSHLTAHILPDNVGEWGKWTYKHGVLKVEFLLNGKDADGNTDATASSSLHSLEELDNIPYIPYDNTDTNGDAVIGLDTVVSTITMLPDNPAPV